MRRAAKQNAVFRLRGLRKSDIFGGPRATAGHRKYSGILEKFYQWPLFTVSILGQHFWSALGSAFATSSSRHQLGYNSKTIARPVCLLKRARVGALSEGNMVEATRVMRKVQPFRVDCTLCFEEWFTDGW